MKILITLFVLLLFSTASAEWTYKELARHPSSDMGTIDVYVEFSESVTGEKQGGCYRFLNDKDADLNLASRMSKAIDNIINTPKPEIQINKSEVETILKEKGFLGSTQTLEDSKTLDELIAETVK